MASGKVTVLVDGRTFEVSNLDKVLYADSDVVKAEVIAYAQAIAPAMLRHISGRPISIVRYPDGIGAESFFQKNLPEGAPRWIHHVPLGSETKDYIVPVETATLAWLANLAALEIHIMNVREPHLGQPDLLTYDIDPADDQPFTATKELAFKLKDHLESLGYHAFVKTSGKRGFHVATPIVPQWSADACFEASKDVASRFVQATPGTTFKLSKQKRRGRTLIDVYRNARGQTVVAPYSLRGAPGAPVSCPLTWEELEELADPSTLNISTVQARLRTSGDAWESMQAFASNLHVASGRGAATVSQPLKDYQSKRDFSRTPEPAPRSSSPAGNRFVIQRHDARRLHYDLRLEMDGVLRSWAIPKGLPPVPGIKRLAVATEDHPIDYLTFEGSIPKGEYGGGYMWVFNTGHYELTRRSDRGLHFRLIGNGLSGQYRIYKIDETDWILEREDEPAVNWLRASLEPMHAAEALTELPPKAGDYHYEMKWDGIRALIAVDEGVVRIQTRNGLDITDRFPELTDASLFRSTTALLDGEIVCLDAEGRPDFQEILKRFQRKRGSGGCRNAYCYLFDLLYLDGRAVIEEPLERRREWLRDSLKGTGQYRLSRSVEDGRALFRAVKQMGLEGIVAKKRGSLYQPNIRSKDWIKIKIRETSDCVIIGYSPGEGERRNGIGALHLAQREGDSLVYRGKVGTGFSRQALADIKEELDQLPWLEEKVEGRPKDSDSVWVEPLLACEVEYASITKGGAFRQGVFVRLRPDLATELA